MESDTPVAKKQANRHGQPSCNAILALPNNGPYVGGDKHRNRVLVYDPQGLLWFVLGRNEDLLLPDLPGHCGVLHGAQRVLVSP